MQQNQQNFRPATLMTNKMDYFRDLSETLYEQAINNIQNIAEFEEGNFQLVLEPIANQIISALYQYKKDLSDELYFDAMYPIPEDFEQVPQVPVQIIGELMKFRSTYYTLPRYEDQQNYEFSCNFTDIDYFYVDQQFDIDGAQIQIEVEDEDQFKQNLKRLKIVWKQFYFFLKHFYNKKHVFYFQFTPEIQIFNQLIKLYNFLIPHFNLLQINPIPRYLRRYSYCDVIYNKLGFNSFDILRIALILISINQFNNFPAGHQFFFLQKTIKHYYKNQFDNNYNIFQNPSYFRGYLNFNTNQAILRQQFNPSKHFYTQNNQIEGQLDNTYIRYIAGGIGIQLKIYSPFSFLFDYTQSEDVFDITKNMNNEQVQDQLRVLNISKEQFSQESEIKQILQRILSPNMEQLTNQRFKQIFEECLQAVLKHFLEQKELNKLREKSWQLVVRNIVKIPLMDSSLQDAQNPVFYKNEHRFLIKTIISNVTINLEYGVNQNTVDELFNRYLQNFIEIFCEYAEYYDGSYEFADIDYTQLANCQIIQIEMNIFSTVKIKIAEQNKFEELIDQQKQIYTKKNITEAFTNPLIFEYQPRRGNVQQQRPSLFERGQFIQNKHLKKANNSKYMKKINVQNVEQIQRDIINNNIDQFAGRRNPRKEKLPNKKVQIKIDKEKEDERKKKKNNKKLKANNFENLFDEEQKQQYFEQRKSQAISYNTYKIEKYFKSEYYKEFENLIITKGFHKCVHQTIQLICLLEFDDSFDYKKFLCFLTGRKNRYSKNTNIASEKNILRFQQENNFQITHETVLFLLTTWKISYTYIKIDLNICDIVQFIQNNESQYTIFDLQTHIFLGKNDTQYQILSMFVQNINKLNDEYLESLQDVFDSGNLFQQVNYFQQMIQRIKEKKKINEVKKRSKINLTKGLKFRIDFEKENGEESCYYVFEPLLVLKKKILVYVFFDFETSCFDDSEFTKKKEINSQNAKNIKVQESYLVSYFIDDMFIDNLNNLFDQLQDKFKIQTKLKLVQHSFQTIKEKHIFNQQCSDLFFYEIYQMYDIMLQNCQIFNELLEEIYNKIDDIKKQKFINLKTMLFLDPFLYCFSYNGSNFDNHFILRSMKLKFGNQFYKQVQITGNLSNIKVLRFKNIFFYDIRLMLGTGQLSQACFDMFKEKKDDLQGIDFQDFQQILQNKEKIIKYCDKDVRLMRKLFYNYRENIHILIKQYIDENEQFQGIEEIDDILQCQFQHWTTASQLSMQIFKQVFCQYSFQSPEVYQIYQNFKDSYYGGFTQSFILGEVSKPYYLDINSLYPYVMKNINIPLNYKNCRIQNYDNNKFINSLNIYRNFIQQTRDIDQIDIIKFRELPINLIIEDEPLNYNPAFGDYDLFKIANFKFRDTTFIPKIPVRTKDYGTIYPLSFGNEQDQQKKVLQDEQKDGIWVWGFQIRTFLISDQIEYLYVSKHQVFQPQQKKNKNSYNYFRRIFENFVEFLYQKRTEYKDNKSMNSCVKLLLNSLYGKFGQKIFDILLFFPESNFNNDQLNELIIKNIIQNENIDHSKYITFDHINSEMSLIEFPKINPQLISEQTLFDTNCSDPIKEDYYQISLNLQHKIQGHIGSHVAIASLITASARLIIQQTLDNIHKKGGQIMYCDTDSIITDRKGFDLMSENKFCIFDDKILGAFKNEYPTKNSKFDTFIKKARILNKKVYQLILEDDKQIQKFKGIKNAEGDMYDQFINQGVYVKNQLKFQKKWGNVTIYDTIINNRLVLARKIEEQNQEENFQKLIPFEDIQSFQQYYQKKGKITFCQQQKKWLVCSQVDQKQQEETFQEICQKKELKQLEIQQHRRQSH